MRSCGLLTTKLIKMDRLKKPKEFLEKLRLSDSDYQDSGMINHIADLLERYHTEQLRIGGVSNSLDLVELERKIDEALDNETSESLKEWLHSKRL